MTTDNPGVKRARKRGGHAGFVRDIGPRYGVLGKRGAVVSIRKGFAPAVMQTLKERLGLKDDLLVRVMGVSQSKLARIRRSSRTLDPVASDRLYRLIVILELAASVMEDESSGIRWLSREQPGLGGAIPLSLLDTEPGTKAVETLLGQLEYGVYP